MDFINFTNHVSAMAGETLGSNYKVKLKNVKKNNGIALVGIIIMQDGSNVSPTIYLNSYYDRYTDGTMTLPDIVNEVTDTYRRNRVRRMVDMRYFLDYGNVKPRLAYKLINAGKNKELLEDIPHMEFLDLAIVFRCVVFQEEFGTGSVLIRNEHLKLWDVPVGQLYQDADENTEKLMPHEITSITDIVSDILKEENPEKPDDGCIATVGKDLPLYVLSNQNRTEGAACMLYKNVLRDFADEIGSSFYIIPSSIHECLLLPSENSGGCGSIKEMIKEVNATQVTAEEVLSDSLYYFDRKEGKVAML